MECKKCGKELIGKQTSFCCRHCSKVYLKAQYRKRNREKLNAYNRAYRAQFRVRPPDRKKRNIIIENYGNQCYRCGSMENLEVHHLKPLTKGGCNGHYNLIPLCKNCHYKIEQALKDFWI